MTRTYLFYGVNIRFTAAELFLLVGVDNVARRSA